MSSGSSDDTVRVWDAPRGAELHTLTGHTHYVESVAWSPDGAYLASGSSDRTVRLWDVRGYWALARTVTVSVGSSVRTVAFSPDGAQLATGLVPSKQDDEERSEKSLGPPPVDCLDGDARCPGVSEVLAVERPMCA